MLTTLALLSLSQSVPNQTPQPRAYTGFGASVCFVSDCDGDGVDEYLIGAPVERRDDGQDCRGTVRLYSGKTGSLLRMHTGPDMLGASVFRLGDFDGDRVEDYGARSFGNDLRLWSGRTGSELVRPTLPEIPIDEVSACEDLDGDLCPDLRILTVSLLPASGSVLMAFSGRTGNHLSAADLDLTELGCCSAFLTGRDLDQDGYADLLVRSVQGESGEERNLVSMVSEKSREVSYSIAMNIGRPWYGDALGFVADLDGDQVAEWIVGYEGLVHRGERIRGCLPATYHEGFAGVHSGRTGRELFPLQTAEPIGSNTYFGSGVADAGDLDGDGKHDIVVFSKSGQFFNPAPVFTYSGANGKLMRSTDPCAETWLGELGYCAAGGSDIDGDGFLDALVSDVHTDMGYPSYEGTVHIVSLKDGRWIRTVEPE
jgi:hypothetical protein